MSKGLQGWIRQVKKLSLNDHGRMNGVLGYISDKDKSNIPLHTQPLLFKLMELQNGNIISGKYEGRARVTQEWLAEKFNLTTRAIGTQLRKLESLGVITIYRTFNPETCRYEINQYSISDAWAKIVSSASAIWYGLTKKFSSKSPEEVKFQSISLRQKEDKSNDTAGAFSPAEVEQLNKVAEYCPRLDKDGPNPYLPEEHEKRTNLLYGLNNAFVSMSERPVKFWITSCNTINNYFDTFRNEIAYLGSDYLN